MIRNQKYLYFFMIWAAKEIIGGNHSPIAK